MSLGLNSELVDKFMNLNTKTLKQTSVDNFWRTSCHF